jgi:mannose-1-phosphate guanylyltransferase
VLGLASVMARDPDARVIIAPSDHYIPRPGPFLGAVAEAGAMAGHVPVTLLGVRADRPETQYGWIVPGAHLAGSLSFVRRFCEKPPIGIARALLRRGALWNTMVTVGTAQDLWALCARHLPAHVRAIAAHMADGGDLAVGYDGLGCASFSRDVLQRALALAVMPLETSGWTDWGCAERVFASLQGSAALTTLLVRLGGPGMQLPG